MKKINIIAFFAIASFTLFSYATNITIRNETSKPIAIYINGQYRETIGVSGHWNVPSWPNEIKIKTSGNIISHAGIQKEFENLWNATQNNPNLTATITVSDKDPFHFEYTTKTSTPRAEFPSVPLIINNNLPISKQGQTAEQVLTDPKSTLNHDSATAQLIEAIEKGYYGTAIEQTIRQFKNTSYRGTSARSSESNNPYNQFLNIIPNTLRSGVPSITQLRNEIKMSVDSILNKMQQDPSKYYTN